MESPQTIPDSQVTLPQVPRTTAPPMRSGMAVRVIATLAFIAALWLGQGFLIPLVAGLMLAMLVMPVSMRLEIWLRSSLAATVLVLLMVMGALAAGAITFGTQLVRVIERAPEMISMAAQQLAERDPSADSLLRRAHAALQELDRATDQLTAARPVTWSGRKALENPAAVVVAPPNSSITAGATVVLRQTAVTGSNALLRFMVSLSIIFFVAFFVLMGGRPLTVRFLRLWSHDPETRERVRRAMLECARQIRIYVGVMVVTNTVVGVAVWLVFYLANLPDAVGWGVTAAILHVVPYLGMTLLTILGSAETFLVHQTVEAALGMAIFLILLSTLVGTLVTAWLQGRVSKINPATIFIGLVFWGELWGVWGLFLGPALVVLIKVIVAHSNSGLRLAQLMQD